MMRRLSLRGFACATRANAAVEFALIAPLLILLAGGIVETGRLFQVYDSVNRLATQYASAWADCSDVPTGACLTEINTYVVSSAIQNIAPQLQATAVHVQMFQVQMPASGTTPTVTYVYPSGATLSPGQLAAAQSAFASNQSGVIVTVSYLHSLQFFQGVMSNALQSALNVSYTVTQLKS